jgi:formylglycine-generating enzyme required for sulfatase activity
VYTPTADLPVHGTTWHRAAAYCNWLSEQEGIPPEQWCYETNAELLSREKVSVSVMLLLQRHPLVAAGTSSYFVVDRRPGVTALRKNYLSLTGYRLPREAEWEYACRAGAVTSRYYGETEELLPKYAWYLKNSQEKWWPVGGLKPNDLGLFDMQGNVLTWCQGIHKSYPRGEEPVEDKEDIDGINFQYDCVMRGGSFVLRASVVRSAFRYNVQPTGGFTEFGFRPARTFTP